MVSPAPESNSRFDRQLTGEIAYTERVSTTTATSVSTETATSTATATSIELATSTATQPPSIATVTQTTIDCYAL